MISLGSLTGAAQPPNWFHLMGQISPLLKITHMGQRVSLNKETRVVITSTPKISAARPLRPVCPCKNNADQHTPVVAFKTHGI